MMSLSTGSRVSLDSITDKIFAFPRTVITKDHKLGTLTQLKLIVSEFRRVEVYNTGVSRAVWVSL